MKSAKFKDSPLGPIPQDWEVKRLGELGEIITGGTPSTSIPNYWGGDIRWMSSGEVHQKRIRDVEGRITNEGYAVSSATMLPVGSIVVALAGQGKTRGTVAITECELCTNQSIGAILPDCACDSEYLYYCLDVQYDNLRAASSGDGSRGGLSKGILENYRVALPQDIEEQRRIATALGEVDKLIESLDEQIEKKRLIAKGVAHDLLSGKKRLPGFKGEWREVAFKVAFISLGNNTYARECLCGDSANAYDIHYGDVLIRFGAVVDFSSDSIPRLKDGIKPNKDFLQDGDIVFADTAEDEMVGKAVEIRGLGDGKAVSGLHTMACRPRADMFAPRFLGYYLNSDSYRKQLLPLITGSKVSSLSRANFESTTLTMPDITEQQAIADLLGEQDAAIAALEAKREKYARIKEGMMRDLLTGKVRMRGE